MNAPLVSFDGVSKVFPNGTVALQDVSFEVKAGTVHAICGENGAGKSTLMKILFGLERPSSGAIRYNGERVAITSARVATGLGIGMVHQHFSLVPSLTVAENILLGQEPRSLLLVDRRAARKRVDALMARYNLNVAPDEKVQNLSVAAQQKVEILKALSRDVQLLILDEPTAVLTPPETDELFARLRDLEAAGLTILFISHKLREVRALARTVTVLRGGRVAGSKALQDIDDNTLNQLVMGDVGTSRSPPVKAGTPGEIRIELKAASLDSRDPSDRLETIDLTVRAGEIVGVAGVDGSGQRGLVSLLSGRFAPSSGMISFEGEMLHNADTARMRQLGMAHLPADRFHQGGAPKLSLIDNASAGAHRSRDLASGPILKFRAMTKRTADMIAKFAVKCQGPFAPLGSLSGGNAQKLIAAREFATRPKFLIADQPTRGIDIAAAAFMHRQLQEQAAAGTGILLVTADLDEMLALADRLVVLFDGRIVARLDNTPDVTPALLGRYMLGLENAA